MNDERFLRPKMRSTLLVGLLLITGVTGCTGRDFQSSITSHRSSGGQVPGSEGGGAAQVVETENGAKLSKDTTNTVKLSGTATGSAAEVMIAPGALQVDTTVSVQGYQASDPDYIASELGLEKGQVKSIAVTEIKATTTETLASPMTISLDINTGTGLVALFLASDSYFVVCTAKKASGLQKAWVIPSEAIKVEGSKVTFATREFGVFEVFKSSQPVPQLKSMSVGAMNAYAKEITVSRLSVQALKADENLTIYGENLNGSTKVLLGGSPFPIVASDSRSLTVAVPKLSAFGARQVTIMNRYSSITKPVFYLGTKTDLPLIDLPQNQVCKGISYYNAAGTQLTGTKFCGLADALACSAERSQNCRLSKGQVAVDSRKLSSAELADGYSLLGVQGTLNFKAALADCNRDGQVDCRSHGDFVAVDKSAIPLSIVKAGETVLGKSGQFVYPTKAECKGSVIKDCRIPENSQDFQAVSATELNGKIIRKGTVLGDVTGVFPSAASPLAEPTAPSLTADNFDSLLSQDAPFRFFDRKGNLQLMHGDADLKPENIVASATIFGVKGSLDTVAKVEGQAKDYRAGYSYAGITGTMKTNCRNLALANTDPLPSHNVAGHLTSEPTVNPWGDDKFACTAEGWKDYAANCTATTGSCLVQDLKSLKMWKTGGSFKGGALAAQGYCANNSSGGFTDWRVPSQKEVMQAFVNGLSTLSHNLFRIEGGTGGYWSATIPHTESSDSPTKYWRIDMTSGFATSTDKNADANYLCVRP